MEIKDNKDRIEFLPTQKGGFSFIEVIVGIVVLSLATISVLGAIGRSYALIEIARDGMRVSQILQEEIEDIKTRTWSELSLLSSSSDYSPGSEFVSVFGDRYSCSRKISNRATDQIEIRLVVSWKDNRGSSHSRETVTWITNEGLYDHSYRSI